MEKRGCFVFVAVCFFVAGFLGFTCTAMERNETLIEKELVAFNDGQGVKGEFFLGCGTIGTENYYFMYAKNSDGGLKQLKVETSKGVIYEEGRKDGLLEIYETRNGFGFLQEGLTKYVIHVLKGTVIRQFKADLE